MTDRIALDATPDSLLSHPILVGLGVRHLSADIRILADTLKPRDDASAYVGKWHLGTGGDLRGFTDFVMRSSRRAVGRDANSPTD